MKPMVFSSSIFLFAFLPVFLGIYFLLHCRTARNIWLLLASLFFYAWGEPVYVLLMLFSIFANWALALAIGNSSEGTRRRWLLAAAVAVDVLVIGFFKYQGFVADNINALVGSPLVANLELPLPIGISFYTLQALSYVIDVYRREVEPQRNIAFLGMYISCFPQLIAGPIVRYQTIADQVLNRRENLQDFTSGLRLFVAGLGKKVLLANTCALIAEWLLAQGGPSIGAVGAWGGVIAYTFQIYFDFGGYSDMAIGLGRMMGFKYLRNFNYPYISQSITDFWRRWHISLSSFFRDYVYIPLGGSRVKPARQVFNIAVVWTITGIWHGAAWNYILWGVYYGVLLICEKFVWGKLLEKLPRPARHLYTILIFVFGWSLFWITDPGQLVPYWQAMLGRFGALGTSTLWELRVWEYLPVFLVCAVASTPIVPWAKMRLQEWVQGAQKANFAEKSVVNPKVHEADTLCEMDVEAATSAKQHAWTAIQVVVDAALLAILVASAISVLSGSFNPFIYFQF